MDEHVRRWLIAEVERLRQVERLRIRQFFQFSLRRLFLLMALVGVGIVAWQLVPSLWIRLMVFVFPNGIG